MIDAWRDRITVEPGKRSGRPCIRSMRITVYDVLSYLAAGMSAAEILDDFPYVTHEDIQACLAFAAERAKYVGGGGMKLLFDQNLSPKMVGLAAAYYQYSRNGGS